ncbi:hypothetical protein [Undibacterium griseum]|uniref:Transcriptional regulator n=1 Tax=Undibacterium griseum TaxID=2762295 RepID=A0ABR6YKE2_9BURK|nr:hypothetical protein [Undibacterium griseum]MBC3884370.1 hypothetical protein [Undibacterium griseum]
MNHKLSIDEYDALTLISNMPKGAKPNACVNRNAKRLSGIKLIAFRRDGGLELTESGREILFIKQCIDGLRTIAANPDASLPGPVMAFLQKKGHVTTDAASGRISISQRGQESLADIDANT